MKNKKIGILGLILVICLGVGGSYALLNRKTQENVNKFTSAYVNIGIVENDDQENINEDLEDGSKEYKIDDNGSVDKKVQIKNINLPDYPTSDTFVRVKVVPVLRDKDGNNAGSLPFTLNYVGQSSKWKEKDGYFYYVEALAPDQVSEYLFTSVEVNGALPENTTLEIQILTEGVQARPTKDVLENGKFTPAEDLWGVYPPDLIQNN